MKSNRLKSTRLDASEGILSCGQQRQRTRNARAAHRIGPPERMSNCAHQESRCQVWGGRTEPRDRTHRGNRATQPARGQVVPGYLSPAIAPVSVKNPPGHWVLLPARYHRRLKEHEGERLFGSNDGLKVFAHIASGRKDPRNCNVVSKNLPLTRRFFV